MSAELLRRAETLIRERAEAAIHDSVGVRSWHLANRCEVFAGDWNVADKLSIADAEHIASWDPDVALTVADMLAFVIAGRVSLDFIAGHKGEPAGQGSELFLDLERHALTLARTYLKES